MRAVNVTLVLLCVTSVHRRQQEVKQGSGTTALEINSDVTSRTPRLSRVTGGKCRTYTRGAFPGGRS